MAPSEQERWAKLLSALDEKLQLGLLNYLNRTTHFFEGNTLVITATAQADFDYLSKPAVFQQLEVLAHDAIAVDKVKLELKTV